MAIVYGRMDFKNKINWTKRALSETTIEPFVFFFMLGFYARAVSFQSLLVDRSCRNILNYTNEVCDNLDLEKYEAEHIEAVQIGNNIGVGSTFVGTVPALVVSIFLGPWSDKYGRKLPIILATTGILIEYTLSAFFTFSTNMNPIFYLISVVFSGCSGGMLVALSQTYSYLSDVTNEKTRPTRFAVLEFFFILSIPLGTVIGGQVYIAGGHTAAMIMGPCGTLCALLWLIFMVRETKTRKPDTTKAQILKDSCQLDNLKDSFKTCLQRRPGNLRMQIWLLVVINCSIMIINVGTATIGFYYTKVMFKWDVSEYSNMATIFYVISAFVTIILVPVFSTKFMLHEAAIGFIGVLSLMAKMVVLSVSFREELVRYGCFCGTLEGCVGIAIRSRMSKLVNKQELGRVFSLLATCEALMPFLGSILMTAIYNATIRTYPGLAYAVAAVVLVPSAIIFGWMTKLPTMSFVQYEEEEETSKVMKEMPEVSNFM